MQKKQIAARRLGSISGAAPGAVSDLATDLDFEGRRTAATADLSGQRTTGTAAEAKDGRGGEEKKKREREEVGTRDERSEREKIGQRGDGKERRREGDRAKEEERREEESRRGRNRGRRAAGGG